MKTIIFQKLTIINFKGIKSLSIDFDMKTGFRGANGAGKTTIADALWWVLFNKDSMGRSSDKAQIKRCDDQGNEIHELSIEVQLELMLNNVTHIFRRTQDENWVTVRGTNDRVFKGNEQKLYYNELNLKTAEYATAVNNILDEDLFKLLTNPMYFMSLDPKKRREELLKLTGSDKTVEESLRKQSSFFLVDQEWSKDINLNKSFTQFFDQMKQDAKKNAREIDEIPVSITELQRTLRELPDEVTLKSLINVYTKELVALNETKPHEKPQNIIEAERLHFEKTLEYGAIVDKGNQEYASKRSETAQARQELEYTIGSLEAKIGLLKNDIADFEYTVTRYGLKRKELLDNYYNVKNQVFVPSHIDDHCPVCHQALPDLNIEQVHADEKAQWELKRQDTLNAIQEEGTNISRSIKEVEDTIAKVKNKITGYENELNDTRMLLIALPDVSKLTPADFVDQAKATAIQEEIKALKMLIDAYFVTLASQTSDNSANTRRQELQAMINDNNQRLGALHTQKSTLARITELESTLKTLEAHKTRYKTLVYLCEVFERSKNETIENALSAHFGRIKWRLFKTNNDGTGYTPVCDPLFDGKPYDAQSTGEKILTGCEIIKCFQSVYEIETPVIVDNRESLTLEIPLTTQIISMYADDRYNALTQC